MTNDEILEKKNTRIFNDLRAKTVRSKQLIEWRADEYTFPLKKRTNIVDGDVNVTVGEPGEISVADYYKERYNIVLKYPHLPIINTGYRGYFPVEFLFQAQEKVFGANDKDKIDAVSETVSVFGLRSSIATKFFALILHSYLC